jgi:glycosyltransferase involved in cell wall biosynthesis
MVATMKIAHVNSALGFGGGELSLLDNAKAMRDHYAIPVVAVINSANSRLVGLSAEHGIPVELMDFELSRDEAGRANKWQNLARIFEQARTLRPILERHAIDLLVTYNFHSGAVAALAKLLGMRAKLVVAHLSRRDQTPGGWTDHLKFLAADAVTYNSEHTRLTYKSASKLYSRPEKIVYSYVKKPDMEGLRGQRDMLLTEHHLDAETAIIGYFGQISEWKRVTDLVEAVGLLNKDSRGTFFLVVVGFDATAPSDYEKRVRKLAEDECPGRHRFFDFAKNPFPLIAACDVLVLPSIEEPFGRVLIEAMYLGVPFVATNAAGPREIMAHADERCGRLVPPRRPDLLAEAINHLVTDRTAERPGVPYAFSREGIVGSELEFYRRLIPNP